LTKLPCPSTVQESPQVFSDIDSDQEQNSQLSFHSSVKQETITQLVDELGLDSSDENETKSASKHINDVTELDESRLTNPEDCDSGVENRTLPENDTESCENTSFTTKTESNDSKSNEMDDVIEDSPVTSHPKTIAADLGSTVENHCEDCSLPSETDRTPPLSPMTSDVDPDDELTVHTIVNRYGINVQLLLYYFHLVNVNIFKMFLKFDQLYL
jgi:hypothetical protein